MRLGASPPFQEAKTEVDERFLFAQIAEVRLDKPRLQFIGDIEQIPPMFSAIKVDGQPLYKKARKGEKIEIEPRNVHISQFELTRIELPEIDFQVSCSKGTYIRSLAHDYGKALRSGAYLKALRRTRVGEFRIEDAWELDELVKYIEEVPVSV